MLESVRHRSSVSLAASALQCQGLGQRATGVAGLPKEVLHTAQFTVHAATTKSPAPLNRKHTLTRPRQRQRMRNLPTIGITHQIESLTLTIHRKDRICDPYYAVTACHVLALGSHLKHLYLNCVMDPTYFVRRCTEATQKANTPAFPVLASLRLSTRVVFHDNTYINLLEAFSNAIPSMPALCKASFSMHPVHLVVFGQTITAIIDYSMPVPKLLLDLDALHSTIQGVTAPFQLSLPHWPVTMRKNLAALLTAVEETYTCSVSVSWYGGPSIEESDWEVWATCGLVIPGPKECIGKVFVLLCAGFLLQVGPLQKCKDALFEIQHL